MRSYFSFPFAQDVADELGKLFGIGFDASVLDELKEQGMAVTGYKDGESFVLALRAGEGGESFDATRQSEIVAQVFHDYGIKRENVGFIVVDKASTNVVSLQDWNGLVIFCFGHHMKNTILKWFKEDHPLAHDCLKKFSNAFFNAPTRESRWVDSQKKQSTVVVDVDASPMEPSWSEELSALVNLHESGDEVVDVEIKGILQKMGKSWTPTEGHGDLLAYAKTVAAADPGPVPASPAAPAEAVVESDVSPAFPPSINDTRWDSTFECLVHLLPRLPTLPDFLDAELQRSHTPQSVRDLAEMFGSQPEATKEALAKALKDVEPCMSLFRLASDPPKRTPIAPTLAATVRKVIAECGENLAAVLKEMWTTYKSRDIFENLWVFSPQKLGVKIAAKRAIPTCEEVAGNFPGLFHAKAEEQLKQYLALPYSSLKLVSESVSFWESKRGAWPDLVPIALMLQYLPISVTRVDAVFSQLGNISNDRAGRILPDSYETEGLYYCNKDVKGHFKDFDDENAVYRRGE